jgi:GT2 family glycosyltransferase
VVRLEHNSGFAVAANRGVSEARGRIVLLLNSDAMVEDGALQAIVDAFDEDPRLGVAGARLLNADGTPQWSGGRTPTLPWMIGVVSGLGHLARFFPGRRGGAQREIDWVSGAAMAFRREAWTPLNERYAFYCQDIEFCLHARREGWHVRILDDALVTHGLGATIASGSALRHDPARLWPDLLAWGTSHYGRRWARLAKIVLVTVAWLRVALHVRRDDTRAALIRAARRLAQSDS